MLTRTFLLAIQSMVQSIVHSPQSIFYTLAANELHLHGIKQSSLCGGMIVCITHESSQANRVTHVWYQTRFM